MSHKTFLNFKIFAVLGLILLAGIFPARVFGADGVADKVLSDVDGYATRLSNYLKNKKAYFEIDIARLKTAEASTTQTETGRAINEAVGNNFVKQTKPTGTMAQTAQRLAEQVLVFFITVALYILAHKWMMYVALAVIVFLLLRLVWRMVGRQQF